eukprot:g46.t1
MIIRVKSLKGKTSNDISIDDGSISTLREKIEAVTGVPTDCQRLLYRGKVLKNEKTFQDYGIKDQSTIHLVTKKPQSSTTVQASSTAAPTTTPSSDTNTSTNSTSRVTMHTHALELPADTSPEAINSLVSGIINRLGGTGAHVNVMSSSTPHVVTSSSGTTTTTSGSNDTTPRTPLSNSWFSELGRLNDEISTYSYTSSSNLQMTASPIHNDNNLKTLSNALLEGHSAMHALQLPLLELSEALRRESSLNMGDRIDVTVAASRLVPALSDMSSLCTMLSRALEGVTTTTDEEEKEEEKTEEKKDDALDMGALDDVLAEFEVDVNADAEAEAVSQLELSRKASRKEKSRKRKEKRRAQRQNSNSTTTTKISMKDLRPENPIFESIPKSQRNDFVASLREDARTLRMGSRNSEKSSAYRELFE